MLSILIVDDETYVCDGIIQNIPWHELGIQSVHQAHTGREGLQLALQLKPDILLHQKDVGCQQENQKISAEQTRKTDHSPKQSCGNA